MITLSIISLFLVIYKFNSELVRISYVKGILLNAKEISTNRDSLSVKDIIPVCRYLNHKKRILKYYKQNSEGA